MTYMFSLKDKYNKFKRDYANYDGVFNKPQTKGSLALPHIHTFTSSRKGKPGQVEKHRKASNFQRRSIEKIQRIKNKGEYGFETTSEKNNYFHYDKEAKILRMESLPNSIERGKATLNDALVNSRNGYSKNLTVSEKKRIVNCRGFKEGSQRYSKQSSYFVDQTERDNLSVDDSHSKRNRIRSDHAKNCQQTMKSKISQDKSYTSGIIQSQSLKSDAKDMKAMGNKTSTEDTQQNRRIDLDDDYGKTQDVDSIKINENQIDLSHHMTEDIPSIRRRKSKNLKSKKISRTKENSFIEINRIGEKRFTPNKVDNKPKSECTTPRSLKRIENSDNKKNSSPAEAAMEADEDEKPWIAYLKSLKVPILCPCHRRIQWMVTSYQDTQKPMTKKEKSQSKVLKRKIVNKNPNCNHNSNAVFNNSSFSNIRYEEQKHEKDANSDLLWADGDNYDEKNELKSLKDLILRLFHDPRFGEKPPNKATKGRYKNRNHMNTTFNTYDEIFGPEEILVDGYKISKESLLGLKKLNPHHKAIIFILLELQKMSTRDLAKEVVDECTSMNNKWDKDCYICVITYMVVQTIKTRFDIGTKDLIETVKKLIEYPIQPLKSTSIRSIFPSANEVALKLKPIKKQPAFFRPKKTHSNNDEKNQGPKRSFMKYMKKEPEDIFEYKLKKYRDNVKKQQIINGLPPNPTGNCRVLKYAIGFGNNSILVHNALSSRWWWSKVKMKDSGYNFLWTQLKNKKFVSQLKKHTEACVVKHSSPLKAAESVKGTDSDIEGTKTNESGDETAATPSSKKRANKLAQKEKVRTKSGPEYTIARRRGGQKLPKPPMQCDSTCLSNHLEFHIHLSNKKALYYNMKTYYESLEENPFDYIPQTFHIKDGVCSDEFLKFQAEFDHIEEEIESGTSKPKPHNIWIIKPGENTNRGSGITVCREFSQIKSLIETKVQLRNNQYRSYIVQKYLERPLLINKRKFDIRCFALITSINGNLCGYWYKEGYIRTASREFSLKNVSNKYIHLTNDAIQKKCDVYGKFEDGNKLNYKEFQKHFDNVHPDWKIDFEGKIYPQMKRLATDSIKATYIQIDKHRRHHSFELFGYDFMVDENQKVWMIEVNTNPCLELASNYLARLIPSLIENMCEIAIDPVFPAPEWNASRRNPIPNFSDNKFELVFNERTDSSELKDILKQVNLKDIIREEDEEDGAQEEEEEDSPTK
ncbi:unnamed protein product [Moneuplotes crassus]|uniref:Uncharacterized protein n=1 Tax=Euplotes crassus TaxID=5936 RepID=A0AAD1XDJ1_EUPCR|nr:unnamed protein product [Moneuplotes crassus]